MTAYSHTGINENKQPDHYYPSHSAISPELTYSLSLLVLFLHPFLPNKMLSQIKNLIILQFLLYLLSSLVTRITSLNLNKTCQDHQKVQGKSFSSTDNIIYLVVASWFHESWKSSTAIHASQTSHVCYISVVLFSILPEKIMSHFLFYVRD